MDHENSLAHADHNNGDDDNLSIASSVVEKSAMSAVSFVLHGRILQTPRDATTGASVVNTPVEHNYSAYPYDRRGMISQETPKVGSSQQQVTGTVRFAADNKVLTRVSATTPEAVEEQGILIKPKAFDRSALNIHPQGSYAPTMKAFRSSDLDSLDMRCLEAIERWQAKADSLLDSLQGLSCNTCESGGKVIPIIIHEGGEDRENVLPEHKGEPAAQAEPSKPAIWERSPWSGPWWLQPVLLDETPPHRLKRAAEFSVQVPKCKSLSARTEGTPSTRSASGTSDSPVAQSSARVRQRPSVAPIALALGEEVEQALTSHLQCESDLTAELARLVCPEDPDATIETKTSLMERAHETPSLPKNVMDSAPSLERFVSTGTFLSSSTSQGALQDSGLAESLDIFGAGDELRVAHVPSQNPKVPEALACMASVQGTGHTQIQHTQVAEMADHMAPGTEENRVQTHSIREPEFVDIYSSSVAMPSADVAATGTLRDQQRSKTSDPSKWVRTALAPSSSSAATALAALVVRTPDVVMEPEMEVIRTSLVERKTRESAK